MPLSSSPQVFSAVQAVVAAYARANGAPAESKLFDLYVEEPLPAEAIIAVHTVGDESCAALSRQARALHARLDVEAGLT